MSPFANRLSTDAPPAVQRLRCLTNYQALSFSDPISTLGKILVERMKKHSAKNGGKYVSVHLRFEEVGEGNFNVFELFRNEVLNVFFCRIWLLSLVAYMTAEIKKK